MIFELAIVEDRGTHYLVTGTTKSSFDGLANREDKVLKLSYNSYQMISEALSENKNVTVTKEMMTDEVLPSEITISEEGMDDFEVYKKINMRRINKKMSYNMANLSSLDILSFTAINTELIAEGYAITNDNREEKYIEIIETENDELIEKLEDYLILLDKVHTSLSFTNMCRSYVKKVLSAESEDEVDEFISEFYETYDTFNR
jgi:hypothetical protein